MLTYENGIVVFAWNNTEREFHCFDLDAVFKAHNKKDWAYPLGLNRNQDGRIDWEYWVDNEPLTVIAFLTIAENMGAFE